VNLTQILRQGALFLFAIVLALQARGQVCECLNCPQPLPPAGLDTCYQREFILNIKGALNNDLSDPFQGICAVNVHFQHNYVWSQAMWLISPGGDTLALTGPALTSGYASSALSSWNISFIPSIYPANPDAGFNDSWSNDQLWEVFRKYSGQYYPAGGPLQTINSGPVNGQWKILLKNCTEIESGQFLNFSIVFCDETGLDCSCQAYAGALTEASPWRRCLGDPSLELSLLPFYMATPPDPGIYGYTFVLAYEDVITGYFDAIDLRTAPAGTYEICGLSYALEDQDTLLLPDGMLTIPLLKDTLFSANPPFCGDISGNCLRIFIGEPSPPLLIDTVLCAGQCMTLGDSTFCASVQIRDTFPAFNGCDSIVELRLTILPPVNIFIRDTICSGEFANVGTNFYNQTGVYSNLLTNPLTGCDSLVILDLVVLQINAQAVAPGLLGCQSPTIALNGLGSTTSFADPDILWEAGPGGNILSGANSLLAFADQAGAYSLILSKTLASGKVCADTALVQVQPDPARPDLQGPPVFFVCAGSPVSPGQLPVLDAGNLGGTYRYYRDLPFDPVHQQSGPFSPQSGDSLFVHYLYGACTDTFLLFFQSVPAPFGELRQGITVCNDDVGGTYNTWVLFDTLLLQSNVVGGWSNTDGAPVSGAFPLVNFAGVPGPASYTFTWTSVNATPPCPNIQRSIEIFVENCACPSVATLPPGNLCRNDLGLWLPALQATSEPGSWTILQQPMGSNPAQILGDSLLVTDRDTGLYRLVFRLDDPPPPGCPDSSAHWFTLSAAPVALLAERDTLCNDPGSGTWPLERILGELILEGDTGGTWQDLGASGAFLSGDTARFEGVLPGTYSFQYTTALGSACPPGVYQMEIVVMACACPPIAVLPTDTLCNDIGNHPLTPYVLQGSPGLWEILATPAGGTPATLNGPVLQMNGADPGEYLLGYRLSQGPGGSCPDRDTLRLTLVAGVSAQVQASDTLCNDPQSGSYPTVLDFRSLLLGGDTGGQWLQLGNSGASGSLPILNFQGVSPGIYDFLYLTTSAQTPCLNRNYPVRIVVRDCNCPIFQDTTLCNNTTLLDLDGLHNHNGAVSWSLLSVPPGNDPATLSGSQLLTAAARPGAYQLEAAWQNPPGRICPEAATVTVQLIGNEALILRSPAGVCNADSPFGPRVLLLDSLILEGAGAGAWTDLDGSGAAGILPLLDFAGVPPGTYRFVYERQASGPCPARRDTLVLQVSDCACPPLSLLPPASVCQSLDSLLLQPLATGMPPGSWSLGQIPSGGNPAQISGAALLINGADPGDYQLIYLLDTPFPGCPDSAAVMLRLDRQPRAGQFADTLRRCPFEPVLADLGGLLAGADPGGSWAFDPGNAIPLSGLDPVTGMWDGPGLPQSGFFRIRYQLPDAGSCQGDTAVLQLEALPALPARAGPDLLVDCGNWPVWLGDPDAPTGLPWLYDWQRQGQSVGQSPRLEVFEPGWYVLRLTHAESLCRTVDSVLVMVVADSPEIAALEQVNPSCLGNNGRILVAGLDGGLSPFLYRINGMSWQSSPVFDNLAAGTYLLEVEDSRGCIADSLLDLTSTGAFSVSLGPDRSVGEGSPVTLLAQFSGNPGPLSLVRWEPLGLICPSCLEQTFTPQQDVQVTVTVLSLEGCEASASLWVRVLSTPARFFIPTAISVNQDGINDYFTLFGNEHLERIESLRIFDRWGNMLFERYDFPHNETQWGWDGSWNGRTLDPGVYVYSAEVRLRDGARRVLKGALTLLR
jgi:gliding motility-associated-like protein